MIAMIIIEFFYYLSKTLIIILSKLTHFLQKLLYLHHLPLVRYFLPPQTSVYRPHVCYLLQLSLQKTQPLLFLKHLHLPVPLHMPLLLCLCFMGECFICPFFCELPPFPLVFATVSFRGHFLPIAILRFRGVVKLRFFGYLLLKIGDGKPITVSLQVCL